MYKTKISYSDLLWEIFLFSPEKSASEIMSFWLQSTNKCYDFVILNAY